MSSHTGSGETKLETRHIGGRYVYTAALTGPIRKPYYDAPGGTRGIRVDNRAAYAKPEKPRGRA
jgi:hypothetical protein